MLRNVTKLALMGAFAVAALVLAQVGTSLAEDKKTTKEIMSAGHKGADALFGKVQAAVKAKDWDKAAAPAKTLADNGALFPKATPPKGDAKSWEKLSSAYAKNTKALADAIEKKEEAAAKKAVAAIGGSCGSCHKAHKP